MGKDRNEEIFRHIVVGNINIDLTVTVDLIPPPDEAIKAKNVYIGPGGGALNYSVSASRFGHVPYLVAVTSELVRSLGYVDFLKNEGVRTEYVKIVNDVLPGISNIIQVINEQRRLISYRGANSLLSSELVLKAVKEIGEFNLIHFSSVKPSILVEFLEKTTGKRNFLISYDPGTETRGNENTLRDLMKKIDVIFMNESEAARIFGKDYKVLLKELSVDGNLIVLKKGKKGGEALHRGQSFDFPAPKVKAVDTTGAGDTFDAVFNGALIEGYDIEKCLKMAVVAGAIKSTRTGSSSSPTKDEILVFIRSYVEQIN